MTDPESTTPKTKAEKYLEDAKGAEGAAARAAGVAAIWLSEHPHLAFWGAIGWTLLTFSLGRLSK